MSSLNFCTTCGNLLPTPTTLSQTTTTCEICHTRNPTPPHTRITTISKPSAFPSTLRNKLRSDVQEVNTEMLQTDAEIQMTCDKCGGQEVRYYTQQLRSADEGSTVFYTCQNVKCGNRWSTNN